MTQHMNEVYASIDRSFSHESAATRRKFVAGAAGMLGGMGLLALPGRALADASSDNTPQTILNVAATAEVLATIVNTVGAEEVHLDFVTRRNVRDAAREELIHFNTLVSLGGKPVTEKIWVPDAVFASKKGLLETLVAGDGIFVNAYQIAITVFGNASKGDYSRYAAEFMGVESVHRALALQSLGRPGNDQAFASASNGRYFTDILTAVGELEAAGFGFGKKGKGPGKFYEFARVSRRTPDPRSVHDRKPH